MFDDEFLRSKEVARLLKVSLSALEKGRSGYGNVRPPFVRVNRLIRYRKSDILKWAQDNTWRSGHGR